jgi:hypothetical protein
MDVLADTDQLVIHNQSNVSFADLKAKQKVCTKIHITGEI